MCNDEVTEQQTDTCITPSGYSFSTSSFICHSEHSEESLWFISITVNRYSAERREVLRSPCSLRMTKMQYILVCHSERSEESLSLISITVNHYSAER